MPLAALAAPIFAGLASAGPAIAVGAGAAAGGIASMAGANAQAGAAKNAAQLQFQLGQESLDFQKQVYANQQKNEAPWLQAGTQAINTLSGLTSTPGQGLLTPWTEQFQAPTAVTEQNDPGYQFRLQQGSQALQNSAAARGGLLSGNTAKAITDYAQNYASNEYSNVYGRAFNEYATRYNQFEQNQSNQFNRLAALSGAGQTAVQQLGQFGQAAAGNVANINLATGQAVGNDIQNAAYQRASGYAGLANAVGGGLNNLSQMMMLQQLLG